MRRSDLTPFTTSLDAALAQGQSGDLVKEAWEDFRGMGYADLAALHEGLQGRADELSRRIEDESQQEEAGQISESEREYPSKLWSYWMYLSSRASAAKAMMHYIEENGPDVPKRKDIAVPPQTVQWAERARPLLPNEGESNEDEQGIMGICAALTHETEDSKSTAYKWLCDRNPLYTSPTDNDQKLKELREAINTICSRQKHETA